MNVRVLSGTCAGCRGVSSVNIAGVPDDKKRDILHIPARVGMMVPRNSFLLIVSHNVWGLASIMNLAWSRSQNFAGSVKTRWQNAWYNIGGNFDKLQEAVNKGRDKRAFAFKLAPASIKNKLREMGVKISGVASLGNYQPIGQVSEGVIISALTAVTALIGVIGLAMEKAGKEAIPVIQDDLDTLPPPGKREGGALPFIPILIGGAILFFVLRKK